MRKAGRGEKAQRHRWGEKGKRGKEEMRRDGRRERGKIVGVCEAGKWDGMGRWRKREMERKR